MGSFVSTNRIMAVMIAAALSAVACAGAENNAAPFGAVAITSDVLEPCADLPTWRPSDPGQFTENELVMLLETPWQILGDDSGLQGAGIGLQNAVGLEFVDPPDDLDERLALLPAGFCIDQIIFTPTPPTELNVIAPNGGASELPEGVEEVQVGFDPAIGVPEPTDTEIQLWVSERARASGREMGERLLGPEVVETENEVFLAFGVIIQLTDQGCPGNPATSLAVELDAPLGERAVINALTGDELEVLTDDDL